jgi:hypothetical protein
VTCGRSLVFSVSFTDKTDCHDITEILLKVALNTITLTTSFYHVFFAIHRKITNENLGFCFEMDIESLVKLIVECF